MQYVLIAWVLVWVLLYATVDEVPEPVATVASECDFSGDDDPSHYCCEECASIYLNER